MINTSSFTSDHYSVKFKNMKTPFRKKQLLA